MKFIVITVDVESDWFDNKTNNITSIQGLHFLQEICDKYNTIPTYLVTYEMATREEAIKIIKEYLDKGKCEIGHHMHIWSTPPFEDGNVYGVDEKWVGGIQSEISDSVFREKMESLHLAIEKNYGVTPTCHRAGRWGIDKRTLLWLEENNYIVDSSVTSYVSWIRTKGIQEYIKTDTRFVPNFPYYPDCRDITQKATNEDNRINVLEVPVTGFKGDFLSNFNIRGMNQLRSILYKIGYKGVGRISFRPSSNLPASVFQKLVYNLFQSNLSIFNFMFHSTELTLGTSPYSMSEDLLRQLKERIIFVLKVARDFGFKGITLSEVPNFFSDDKS